MKEIIKIIGIVLVGRTGTNSTFRIQNLKFIKLCALVPLW